MKSLERYGIVVLLCIACVWGQSTLQPYHSRSNFLLASPGAFGNGLYGYDNPALLGYVHQPDAVFIWSDETGDLDDLDNWGLFSAIPHLGFGTLHHRTALGSITDYYCAIGLGSKTHGIGFGYNWSSGDTDVFGRTTRYTLGMLVRPDPRISLGLVGNITKSGDREGMIDLALRPFADEKLTLFCDYAIGNGQTLKQGNWSTGAVVEALPGIRLTGHYFHDRAFSFGFNVSLGRIGFQSQALYTGDQEYAYNTYGVRIGAYDRTVTKQLTQKDKHYLRLELSGRVKYQRYALFDRSYTLLELMTIIQAAQQDVTVSGIAVNLSGLHIDRAIAWELRETLKDFRASGKHVVIFIDDVDMEGYHLASIADRVVMDPYGGIYMAGSIFGRMYIKGLLDKLGVGVDEWRYFTYKSAGEMLSRESMSDPDREQWQAIVDDAYDLAREDICVSRNITHDSFDDLVNTGFIYLAREAHAKGLVDTMCRWESISEVIATLEGGEKSFVTPHMLEHYHLPHDDHWGEKPQIAVIYALGICAMDEGITARSLVKDIDRAADDPLIKAVVFRVDSPGGDPIASDVVAQALNRCREKKPVIVSQGYVAGSGGYWLSMYGDTIVASPNTITGSIGVIGVWLYDRELKQKLGVETDHVKKGDHADFGFGFAFPFVGTLPDRGLTGEERARVETIIRELYHDFVAEVAAGRNRSIDEIERVAQGRVWSGKDALANGLVDVLGTLETAIMIAKHRAGIEPDDEVALVELPKPGLISPDIFTPRIAGIDLTQENMISLLSFYAQHNGRPMPMLPMEHLGMLMQ